jgi:hypothetical protein
VFVLSLPLPKICVLLMVLFLFGYKNACSEDK